MESFEGTVLLVQESRFLVQSDTGRHRLFILSHRAAAEPAQVAPLQTRHARVRVWFSPSPDMIADTAYRVAVL